MADVKVHLADGTVDRYDCRDAANFVQPRLVYCKHR